MKRLIIAAIILLFLLSEPVTAVTEHTVYLPLVSVPRVAVIDCADANGRLMECP
jgi:hypothetical protein